MRWATSCCATPRLGGDEFAVLPDGLTPVQATPISDARVTRLPRPYAIRGAELQVSVCIGRACFPDAGDSADALIEAAEP